MSWHPSGVDSWSIAAGRELLGPADQKRDVDPSAGVARGVFPFVLLAELGVILLIAWVDGLYARCRFPEGAMSHLRVSQHDA